MSFYTLSKSLLHETDVTTLRYLAARGDAEAQAELDRLERRRSPGLDWDGLARKWTSPPSPAVPRSEVKVLRRPKFSALVIRLLWPAAGGATDYRTMWYEMLPGRIIVEEGDRYWPTGLEGRPGELAAQLQSDSEISRTTNVYAKGLPPFRRTDEQFFEIFDRLLPL